MGKEAAPERWDPKAAGRLESRRPALARSSSDAGRPSVRRPECRWHRWPRRELALAGSPGTARLAKRVDRAAREKRMVVALDPQRKSAAAEDFAPAVNLP